MERISFQQYSRVPSSELQSSACRFLEPSKFQRACVPHKHSAASNRVDEAGSPVAAVGMESEGLDRTVALGSRELLYHRKTLAG